MITLTTNDLNIKIQMPPFFVTRFVNLTPAIFYLETNAYHILVMIFLCKFTHYKQNVVK